MRAELGKAVCELRRRLEWSQDHLGYAITRHGGRPRGGNPETYRLVISRWENSTRAPAPVCRMALAKIAANHGHEDLARVFRKSIAHWRAAVARRDEKPELELK